MASPLETEIKLAASPAMLEMLRSNPKITGDDRISTLVTTYYDTVARSLWHGGAILRVREADDKREQTLKITPAGGSTVRRHEWNVPITQGAADWSKFPTPANSILTELLGDGRLKAVGTTRIERTTRRVHFGHSIIDVTFDQGTIEASSKILPVSELELELAHGKLVDVVALTLELPLGPDLAWSVRSKAERCRNLAFDLMPSGRRSPLPRA